MIPMNESDLFRFVYDEYKIEFDHADALYRKSPVVVTAISLIGAAIGFLGNIEGFRRCFDRIDFFLYAAASAAAAVGLLWASILLGKALAPKRIPRAGTVKDWADRWHEHPPDQRDAVSKEIISQLGDVYREAVLINRQRDTHFASCVRLIVATVPIAIAQGIMYLILRLEGLIR
jgi:hypothetical protein